MSDESPSRFLQSAWARPLVWIGIVIFLAAFWSGVGGIVWAVIH